MRQLVYEKENSEFKPVKLRLKIDLVSYPARAEGLVNMIVIGCSFTFARKGYDNHHCHNKPRDRKWGCNVDDVMPGRGGPENLRILKKSQLKVDIGPCRQTVEFSAIGA